MKTKIEVQRAHSTGVDVPQGLSSLVNQAVKHGEKFVTFTVPPNKKLSIIAERVESIWQE